MACKLCTHYEHECLTHSICPDCKRTSFREGPHGGLCVNIMCANLECGSRFNVGPLTAERISEAMPLAPKELPE